MKLTAGEMSAMKLWMCLFMRDFSSLGSAPIITNTNPTSSQVKDERRGIYCMISYLVDVHMYRISSRSDTVATIYFTGCFVWLLFDGGYYSRVATIRGQRLSKGGVYSKKYSNLRLWASHISMQFLACARTCSLNPMLFVSHFGDKSRLVCMQP